MLTALERIPDWNDDDGGSWVEAAGARARAIAPSARLHQIDGAALSYAVGPLSAFGSATFRRFVVGLLGADLAVYGSPADMVDIERLSYVVAKYPAGFRLWLAEDAFGAVPVGYTGFYPISESSFERLATSRPPLEDRFLHPAADVVRPFLYIFNYSIVPNLRRSAGSAWAGGMIRALDADLQALDPRGLSAITVSPDGVRVCRRWGLAQASTFVFAGEVDCAQVVRRV